jgi:hypothetical protein
MASSNFHRAWEGLGGPVSLDPYHLDGIDPTLESCCQREIESNRRYNALTSTLHRHDVTILAERRRRHVLHDLKFGSGCRCSYDPNADGGEYRALMELRSETPNASFSDRCHENKDQTDSQGQFSRNDEEESQKESDDEFDYLLDEDLPMDNDAEERRRAELEMIFLTMEVALCHGYGTHRQMHPDRVLKAAGLDMVRNPPAAVVLHLFDPDSRKSASLDLFLESLALECKGTKFLRSGGRSTLLLNANSVAKGLSHLDPNDDNQFPVLLAIRHGDIVATSSRLEGFFDNDTLIPNAIRQWLDNAHVLITSLPPFDVMCRIRPEEDALLDNMRIGSVRPAEESNRYDCGVLNCSKPFFHEHVGISTKAQDGLLISEETVKGNSN